MPLLPACCATGHATDRSPLRRCAAATHYGSCRAKPSGARIDSRAQEASITRITPLGNWIYGPSLVALTLATHAAGVTFMVSVLRGIRLRLESRSLRLPHVFVIVVGAITAMGLLLAALHGIEAAFWAAAYVWRGALGSPKAAILYSVDAMTTRGASGLTLQSHWQIMGALEAANGMLLFGISTAFIFSVLQFYNEHLVVRALSGRVYQTRRGPDFDSAGPAGRSVSYGRKSSRERRYRRMGMTRCEQHRGRSVRTAGSARTNPNVCRGAQSRGFQNARIPVVKARCRARRRTLYASAWVALHPAIWQSGMRTKKT